MFTLMLAAAITQMCLQTCAHLLVKYFNADDCYTHYVKNNCAVIKPPGGGYDKVQDDIQWAAREPQEVLRSAGC
jgi:hypothetical protein